MHRDISHSNVMYRRLPDGKIVGVLNDYDLASVVDEKKVQVPTSTQRTGTKPFMAIDLLSDEPPLHLYRHDLESMFWVMIWHVCRYEDGEFRGDQALFEEWTRVSTLGLAKEKRSFLYELDVKPAQTYQLLTPLLENMLLVLDDGIRAKNMSRMRKDSTFDHSTLNGRVSFQVFEDLFTTNRPSA